MTQDRRTFLKTSTAALSAAAVGGCAPDTPRRDGEGAGGRHLDGTTLRAVAALVLPSELGAAGREQAVQEFERWAEDYEPVPELNHGYGTSEIRYGPADPVPGWAAQLQALELEAARRTGAGFGALDGDAADALLRRHVGDPGGGMPSPLRAGHVAVALLSWWLSTPDATDRCYGVRIAPQTCRGIESAPREPEAVS
ncbi:MAG TPA: twin-arginine translocation signal domain-containing protein [Longimicrobiales bacterium]|nr:twin-arginine translocation signal domain-containing protein [Longimicrobiales bacterium]